MAGDSVAAARTRFSIADPWRSPPAAGLVRLRRATDGDAPRLATTVSVAFDDECLTLVFSASDDHIVATYSGHDEPLYEEDVVEVFLAPERASEYYEIEVNPLATRFDARIVSPNGTRESMQVDLSWNAKAMAAVRKVVEVDGSLTVDTLLRVPFSALGRRSPEPGESWLANFFRIDRHPVHGDEYSAWRPTMRDPADFHVTAVFGSLEFHF